MDNKNNLLDVPEHMNEPNNYRKLVTTISKHSNYPLVFSLIGALTGSIVYTDDPIYGFVCYAWTFLFFYVVIVVIYVLFY